MGTALCFFSSLLMCISVMGQNGLAYGFDCPQDSARTKVWWFHGETVGTHDGITADLEAFKQQGVGGVIYYDQVHGDGEGAFKVFSPQWWDELIFSAQEARRLGLSFEINASNGYVAGGRWITPDKSMQRLCSHDIVVNGGGDVKFQMPKVKTPGNWQKTVMVLAVPYDEKLMGDSRNVFSIDSIVRLSDPSSSADIDIDFGHQFTARSITYVAGARGKARTSSMQVPAEHFKEHPTNGIYHEGSFFGCGFRQLPDIGELQVSDDGTNYRTICSLRPKYQNLGGSKEQTLAFPATTGRYFRIRLHGWASGMKADDVLTFGNVILSASAKVDVWQEKASFVSELMETDRTPRYALEELVDFSHAIDLTAFTDDKGVVTWKNSPKGQWLVLRLFAASTGGHTKHGRKDALGLECDKLSIEGVHMQWENYVKPIIDTLRIRGGNLMGVCMDSHEAGPQNWTADFEQKFQHLRGYDMRKYLPVMAGYVVGSAVESNRFLNDFRHTINDLITDKYYGEFNRLCHSEGLTLTAQAIGGALCMAGDAISVKKLVDKPQAEFWGYQTEGNYDIKDCSSAAHVYGKQIASGEAFTDITYKHSLADIKNLADYAFAYGINELVVCAVAYQPWGGMKISTANGRQYVLNRKNTLWPVSKPFWDYQARCSWMLRQGKPVSDICLYLGDDIPNRILGHKLPDMKGYDFDAFTTDALLNRMIAKDGRIVLPDGKSYQMMILPSDGKLTDEAKKRIEELRSQGVEVFDPQSDSRSLSEAFHQAGLTPDVETPSDMHLYFCHRRVENGKSSFKDIYFLNNHSDDTVSGTFRFRTEAESVALWNPVTGERYTLKSTTMSGKTSVNLTLHARESYFIVLSNKKDLIEQPITKSFEHNEFQTIPLTNEKWTVTFDAKMGGPSEQVIMDRLADWTTFDNPHIKYFSGTAVYRNSCVLKKKENSLTYRLNLPLLNSAAEVFVNGKSAGIVWCSPWDIDITQYLKKGKNQIELHVCNTLWNRLVGDASLPERERITWQTTPLAKSTDSLVPSGFSDDVVIISYKK